MLEQTPFRSLVIEKSFIKPGMPIQDIYTIEDNPEIIVRAGLYDEYDGENDRYGYYKEHLDNKDLLNKLRNHYGLFVPNFQIVVGGRKRFYIITQRVHGANLHERIFLESETEEAKQKLSNLYSSLTDVLIDTCNIGGTIICDLVRAGADTSGNKQWVYGKRKEDLENQVWLVDLGPAVGEMNPHDRLFFNKQFPHLFEMIVESEKKLGCKFNEARERLLNYMQTERSAFDPNDFRFREIDVFFRHQKMFGNI